ncbi:hypothetical protein [Spirosoma harenae]
MFKHFLFVGGLCTAILACNPDQPVTPQQASEPIDSLITLKLISNVSDGKPASPTITMKLPRFDALVRLSHTPAGQLDRTVGNWYNKSDAGTQYLYNDQGQPMGSASFPQDKIWGGHTFYYEYADNRIYRVYTKVYEGELARDFIYFLNELHYDNGRLKTMYLYYLNLAKGEAYFNGITDFETDPQGHITAIKDRRENTAYPVFTWKGDNIISRQDYYGNGTPIGFGYTYTHDDKVNPLKKLELPYNPVSANNELSETVRYTNVDMTSYTNYELSYNPSGTLSSSIMVQQGTSIPRQPPVYYFYK